MRLLNQHLLTLALWAIGTYGIPTPAPNEGNTGDGNSISSPQGAPGETATQQGRVERVSFPRADPELTITRGGSKVKLNPFPVPDMEPGWTKSEEELAQRRAQWVKEQKQQLEQRRLQRQRKWAEDGQVWSRFDVVGQAGNRVLRAITGQMQKSPGEWAAKNKGGALNGAIVPPVGFGASGAFRFVAPPL